MAVRTSCFESLPASLAQAATGRPETRSATKAPAIRRFMEGLFRSLRLEHGPHSCRATGTCCKASAIPLYTADLETRGAVKLRRLRGPPDETAPGDEPGAGRNLQTAG